MPGKIKIKGIMKLPPHNAIPPLVYRKELKLVSGKNWIKRKVSGRDIEFKSGRKGVRQTKNLKKIKWYLGL